MRKLLAAAILVTQLLGLQIAHAYPYDPNFPGRQWEPNYGPVQPSNDFWFWIMNHRPKPAEPIDLCQHRVELIEDYKHGVEVSIQTYDQYAARKAELQALAKELELAKAACVTE
jgi:hypothetical protein